MRARDPEYPSPLLGAPLALQTTRMDSADTSRPAWGWISDLLSFSPMSAHNTAQPVGRARNELPDASCGARDAPFPPQTLPAHFKQLTGPVGTCLFNFQVGSVTLCIFRWWSLIAASASFSAAQGGPRRTAGCKRRVPWRPIPLADLLRPLQTTYWTSRNVSFQVSSWISDTL